MQENLNILDRASAYKRPNCTDLNVLLSDSPFLLAKKSSNACMTLEVEYQRCGRSKELDISFNEALLNKFPLKSWCFPIVDAFDIGMKAAGSTSGKATITSLFLSC